mgnify:FL=1
MPDTYFQKCVHIYDLQIDILKEKKNRFTVMQRSTVVTVIRTGYVHLSILHTTQEKNRQIFLFIFSFINISVWIILFDVIIQRIWKQ